MPYRLLISEESINAYIAALLKACFHNAELSVKNISDNLVSILTGFIPQIKGEWHNAVNLYFQNSIKQIQTTKSEFETAMQLLWNQTQEMAKYKPLICITDEDRALIEELASKEKEYTDISAKLTFLEYLLASFTEIETILQAQTATGLSTTGEYFEFSDAFFKHYNENYKNLESEVDAFFDNFIIKNVNTAASSATSNTPSPFAQRLAQLHKNIRAPKNDAQVSQSSSSFVPQFSNNNQSSSSSTGTQPVNGFRQRSPKKIKG